MAYTLFFAHRDERAHPPKLWMLASDSSIVLRHGEERFGDQFGARDAWVFESGGEYCMHYDAAGSTGWLAALATSDDGLTWCRRRLNSGRFRRSNSERFRAV